MDKKGEPSIQEVAIFNESFNLKRSIDDLPLINDGVSKSMFEQISAKRSVNAANFESGDIIFEFSLPSNTYLSMKESYVRIRADLTYAGAAPVVSNDCTWAMNAAANLFRNADFQITGKTVSRIEDNFAQIASLKMRLMEGKEHMNGVALDWEPNYFKRLNTYSSDGQVYKDNTTDFSCNLKDAPDLKNGGLNMGTSTIAIDQFGVMTFAFGGTTPFTHVNQFLKVGDDLYYGLFVDGKTDPKIYGTGKILSLTDATHAVVDNLPWRYSVDATTLATQTRSALLPTAVNTLNFILTHHESGSVAQQRANVEFCLRLPLSICDVDEYLPGACDYRLILRPEQKNIYVTSAVESYYSDKTVSATTGINISVNDIYFMARKYQSYRPDDGDYFYALNEVKCIPKDISSANTSLTKENIPVSANTQAISIAFQSSTAGTSTRFSKSKLRTALNSSGYPGELGLKRLYVQYAGQNIPSPDLDASYLGSNNYIREIYNQTQIYTGKYLASDAPESFQEWLDRGMILHLNFNKDSEDRNTQAYVNYAFETLCPTTSKLLVFEHSSTVIQVSIKNSKVVEVIELN
jgi:hypothetical protein